MRSLLCFFISKAMQTRNISVWKGRRTTMERDLQRQADISLGLGWQAWSPAGTGWSKTNPVTKPHPANPHPQTHLPPPPLSKSNPQKAIITPTHTHLSTHGSPQVIHRGDGRSPPPSLPPPEKAKEGSAWPCGGGAATPLASVSCSLVRAWGRKVLLARRPYVRVIIQLGINSPNTRLHREVTIAWAWIDDGRWRKGGEKIEGERKGHVLFIYFSPTLLLNISSRY